MNNDHYVYSSNNWNKTSIATLTIPNGSLCIEYVTNYTIKLKIGDGKHVFSQLPYVIDGVFENEKYYDKIEIDNKLESIENNISNILKSEHSHANQSILDDTTASFTITDKNKLDSLYLYDDNELRGKIMTIEQDSHIHTNQSILNEITAAFTINDKHALDSLVISVNDIKSSYNNHVHKNKEILDSITSNFINDTKTSNEKVSELLQDAYDSAKDAVNEKHHHHNQEILNQITNEMIDNSHHHENIDILNNTSASFTTHYQHKLDRLEIYYVFSGASETSDGSSGLVPKPSVGDQNKFLKGDGTWQTIDNESVVNDSGWISTQINEVNIKSSNIEYRKIANGIMEICGTFTPSTSFHSLTLFTLPNTFRPHKKRVFAQILPNILTPFLLTIDTTGSVNVNSPSSLYFEEDIVYQIEAMFII